MRRIAFISIILGISSCLISCTAQVPGCTDPLANNYDPSATFNDGSCTYDPVSISLQSTSLLSDQISETSVLINWNGVLWTHNDNADTVIYGLDSMSGDIVQTYSLNGVRNIDWEEISQDDEYIYIGDFGNNSNGNQPHGLTYSQDRKELIA